MVGLSEHLQPQTKGQSRSKKQGNVAATWWKKLNYLKFSEKDDKNGVRFDENAHVST